MFSIAGPNFVGANARITRRVIQGIAGFALQSQRPYRVYAIQGMKNSMVGRGPRPIHPLKEAFFASFLIHFFTFPVFLQLTSLKLGGFVKVTSNNKTRYHHREIFFDLMENYYNFIAIAYR
jgi:hypothetical protein